MLTAFFRARRPQTQFGQIKLNYLLANKLEWKTQRIQNYDQVVDFMAQNLQFVQQVRRPSYLTSMSHYAN
jgi:hypothetical protein